uniref:HAT C-terminal dimerisation domain-containing protein n=1 Tax=Lactuca sativa TaxID=4236 RepID=A0A9R1VZI4_LACSA|nr:hypothetical protein LSAT_V11C400206580 [Lactuca sativa]
MHVSNYTFNADTSRKDLAEMIIVHEKVVGGLQPLFKVPCRNTIKGDIKSIYDYIRDKTMSLLAKNKSRIAVTTNMWTSNYKKGSKLEFSKKNYELKFVELHLPVLYGEENTKIEFQNLEGFVKTLFQEYESNNASKKRKSEGFYGCSVPGSSSFGSSISSSHRVGFENLLSDIASITRDDDESRGMSDLDNYLKEKLLPKDMELDMLALWKTNGIKYPRLQRIAKDILAIPVSTVASESTFNTSRRLVCPHHSRLHPKTLEALMCAQSWLLNEIRETEAYCHSIEFDYDVEEW